MIICVTGYEEEVSKEPSCNPSPGSNGDSGWFKLQTKTSSEGEDEQRFQSAMGDQVVQELTPEARTEEEKGPAKLCTTACQNQCGVGSRAVGPANFLKNLFSQSVPGRVKHLNCFTSDHQPILLALNVDGEHQKWCRKPFRFKAMWISDPRCRETITKAWDCALDGTPMFVASQKQKKVHEGFERLEP
ncbi:hypothetical protein CFP56_023401 [Quercus suber]|uniref:Uncharacterized protein n=1 Tax=Quercus suber TaxID=58331 RepID=A0AAW0K9C4_QUESU